MAITVPLWQHLASSPMEIPSACKGTSHPEGQHTTPTLAPDPEQVEHPAQGWAPSIQAKILVICCPEIGEKRG